MNNNLYNCNSFYCFADFFDFWKYEAHSIVIFLSIFFSIFPSTTTGTPALSKKKI